MTYKFLAVIPVSLLLASCSASVPETSRAAAAADVPSPRPSWIDGAAAGYPRGRFLTGVGAADDPGAAKDRARGEISRVFLTQVTMNTAVTAFEYSSESQGKTAVSSAQNVTQNVRSVSQKDLEGVEIAETWRDGPSGRYYALAVLDRSKALLVLEGRIRELDARLRDNGTQLAAAAEKMQKAKHALKSLELIKAREVLEADMRVLDPASVSGEGPEVNAARREAFKALSGLDVVLVMSAENSGPVAAAVIKALNVLGIEARNASSEGGADIAVDCSVEFSPVPDKDPRSRWKWSRGAATVNLKDVRTSRIFLNFEASAKEASSTGDEARTKTESALGRKISAEILRGIAAYLENK